MLIQKAIVTAFPASTALPTNNKQSPTDTSPFLLLLYPPVHSFSFCPLLQRCRYEISHFSRIFPWSGPGKCSHSMRFSFHISPPIPPFLINKFAPLPLPLMYLPYYLLNLERVNGCVGVLWIPSQPLQRCKKKRTRGPQWCWLFSTWWLYRRCYEEIYSQEKGAVYCIIVSQAVVCVTRLM